MQHGDQVCYLKTCTKLYLAEDLTFQIHGFTQFIYIHVYTEKMRSQNYVGFPNILLIEMLYK